MEAARIEENLYDLSNSADSRVVNLETALAMLRSGRATAGLEMIH